MSVYQQVKFSQALASSSLVLIVGLVAWFFIDYELSVLGTVGWLSLPVGMLLGTVLYGFVFWLTKLFWVRLPSMRGLIIKLNGMFSGFGWPSIIVISIMAGVSEELLLRGVLQTFLVDVLNPFWGIVLASLIFGLMHFLSRAYVVVTFTLGLLFGLAYYFTDSLLFVIAAHAIYDVFAFAVLVKFPSALGIETYART